MEYKVTSVLPNDASILVDVMCQLSLENDFMMYENHEVPTPEVMYRRLVGGRKTAKEKFFLVQTESQAVGYVLVFRGSSVRNFGSGTIVLGILKDHQGKGVGSQLMQAAITWARHHNLYRLQLQVHLQNERALSLYKKFGFEIEGVLKKCALIKGNFIDKYMMALLL